MAVTDDSSIYYLLFTIHPFLFLKRMPAGRSHASLGTVAFNLILDPRWASRLRIDQLHVGNINESFFLDNAAAAIILRAGLLMAFYNARALNFDLAGGRRHFEHATTFALVAAGNNDHLIVLLYF